MSDNLTPLDSGCLHYSTALMMVSGKMCVGLGDVSSMNAQEHAKCLFKGRDRFGAGEFHVKFVA